MEGFTLTHTIILITCLVSLTTMFYNPEKIYDLSLRPTMIRDRKQYYRFFTCGLVHADLMHLGFNMLSLYFCGRFIEQTFEAIFQSKFYFLIFYVLGIILSGIPTYIKHKNDDHYSSIGASGAVSAVIYATVLFAPWAKIYVLIFPMPLILYAVLYIVMTAYLDKRQYGDGINHSAHLWGAIFGLIFPIIFKPQIVLYFLNQLMHPSFF
ncbi:MAG: Rhomboid family protein [Bacteroidetes bacterium]|uniref:rhomboid family intramembrane serine protease n=1 Tax=unclassified Chitinophaga TaxID=2619133 RepID=UPI0009CF316B|nr:MULTISPECIES: rhomboid family intramembrane serine protease [unclassified Chitinophaga]MBP1652960.1 Rhomboid family protein [Bacteroidota bacterium]OMP77153.1 rhomboid family intramembrane serine protease [[Flexibacter] sp. ATCC 35208]WPV65062.1 rhomboid family intramembrane serine protease [Chitinophaga sp. LS1]